MKKKTKSTKNINPNRKFETGPELINKLDKLYYKSLKQSKNSSVKDLFFSGFRSSDKFDKNIFRKKSDLKIKNPQLQEIFSGERKSINSINVNKSESIEIRKENNEEAKNILGEKAYESGSEKVNNKLLNISKTDSSLHSYKPEEMKMPKIPKDYYSSFLDKFQILRRERLLQSSIDFYLHQGKYKNKYVNYKKEYVNLSAKKKYQPFSELKRVPDLIAFGKVVPKESIEVQKENKKHRKKVLLRAKSTIIPKSSSNSSIFRTGLINNHSVQKLKEYKLIKDDYNTNNPNTKDYIPKDSFGNTIYPIFGQKKMLKNIMPKEYDYNTNRTPLELLHDTYHPLLRFQKKMINQHINAINQEIGVTYSKYFTLVDKSKIPEKFQMCQELIDLQKDEKLIKLIRELIDRNFGLEEEVEKALDSQKKEKEIARKKRIYKKFSEVMIKASIHFKRLNISLEDFYSIPNYIPSTRTNNETMMSVNKDNKENNKIKETKLILQLDKDEEFKERKILMEKNGQHFFHAIKAEDSYEIISIVNSNYFIMFYRDVFLQSPLHIAAKRNLYKFVSLFVSRGADINAQDEGGRTALFIAAERNNLEFVTVLLFEIADPSIKNAKDEKPAEITTDTKIRIILERARVLHYFHKIGKIKEFNESIKRGLKALYRDEMGMNTYELWLKENEEIVKECEK